LHFPIFNASETTLQQLIQVAGRAGRQSDGSRVIVQTMHEHKIFNNLNEQDYLKFCKTEMDFRQEINYPPFGRLVEIELKNTDSQILQNDAKLLCEKLHTINNTKKLGILILGPAKPIVYRIQKTESRQIFLKTNSFKTVHLLLNEINFENFSSNVFIVPTP